MDTTGPNAASKSRRGAAMGNAVWLPENEDEAVEQAVKSMLSAANLLCTAADLAPDGTIVEHYLNTAIRLRDIANSLAPDRPDWPANVIPFVPRGA